MSQLAALAPWLRAYTLFLLGVSTVGCWLFVFLYHRAYRWWTNELGRHLVTFTACLGSFLTYYVVLAVWPSMPDVLRHTLRTVLFTLFAAAIVWRLVLFGRIRLAQLREEKDAG